MIGFLQIFIAEAAAQALLSVAVGTLQLYQCLGVARPVCAFSPTFFHVSTI